MSGLPMWSKTNVIFGHWRTSSIVLANCTWEMQMSKLKPYRSSSLHASNEVRPQAEVEVGLELD